MRIPRWLRRVEPWRIGVAVRREWPDGTHDLFGWRTPGSDLNGPIRTDRASWLRSPMRPVAYSVVPVSVRDFVLHGRRDSCRAPDCPTEHDPAPVGTVAAR